jgi:hypothetical protein
MLGILVRVSTRHFRSGVVGLRETQESRSYPAVKRETLHRIMVPVAGRHTRPVNAAVEPSEGASSRSRVWPRFESQTLSVFDLVVWCTAREPGYGVTEPGPPTRYPALFRTGFDEAIRHPYTSVPPNDGAQSPPHAAEGVFRHAPPNSSMIPRLNAGMSSGLRLETRLPSVTTS